jgi:hypothetical protein
MTCDKKWFAFYNIQELGAFLDWSDRLIHGKDMLAVMQEIVIYMQNKKHVNLEFHNVSRLVFRVGYKIRKNVRILL